MRDESPVASNWRSEETLDAYLARHGVVGIADVDTRKLTRHLRDKGSQNGAIGTESPEALLRRARAAPDMNGLDLVQPRHPEGAATRGPRGAAAGPRRRRSPPQHHVVVFDYGIKRNILRCLVDSGCRLTVVPASTSASDVLALKPDGIFLSNGPGDPAAVSYAVDTIKGLLGKQPIFGICLGHQLLALALGARTYKLKFGHRGANQPVKDLATGRVEITTQNHGFCVDLGTLPPGASSTHVHLNDGTSEGLAVPSMQRVQRAVPPRSRRGAARRALHVRALHAHAMAGSWP